VGNLGSAIDELAGEDLAAAGPRGVGEELVELFAQVERIHAEALRRLLFLDRSGAWADDGALSTQAWLRRRTRMAPGAAAERVRVARHLDALPETRAAFAAGEIGYAHVRVISSTIESSDACRRTAGEAEAILVDAARDLDPPRLRRAAEHWRHAVDPPGFIEAEWERHARRHLHVSSTFEGMVALDGELDAEGGATLMSALDALQRPVPGETRTPSQRRADAVVELARRQLDAGTLPVSGGEKPHLAVTVDLATLERRAGSPAAEVAWANQPISREAARRLACDAGISRIITDGASQPLDVGRRTRTIPPPLRRAVIARDGGCVAPGCDRPPEWCDVHHRVHWIDGGPTALPNLELRCHPHHHPHHHQMHPDDHDRSPP